jgi:hypothetical protein
MLPFQRRILADLHTSKDHVVINADKNMGPCIIERAQYMKRALQDHLLDANTYQSLTPTQATGKMEALKTRLLQFIEYYERKLDPSDIKFLKCTTDVIDPYPKFYVTAKIH